jgi:hypothetical protein
MHHRSRASRIALIVAAVLGGVAAMAPSGRGTLVHAVPIAIEIEHSGASSSFALTDRREPFVHLSDRGRALVINVSQRVGGRGEGGDFRFLVGDELLRGRRGTLTLRWSGSQHRRGRGWGRLSGSWSVVNGTGEYADRSGRGCFISDKAAAEFVGWLITAV